MNPNETAAEQATKNIQGYLDKCYIELTYFLSSFEKGNIADTARRIKGLEINIALLRQAIAEAPGISGTEEKQIKKINDLRRQLFEKDRLISTFADAPKTLAADYDGKN